MREKTVYRDKASGRLITRYDAERRDPSTWMREQMFVVDPRDEPDPGQSAEDLLADVDEELDSPDFDQP